MAGRKPKPTAVKKPKGNPRKRKLNTKEPKCLFSRDYRGMESAFTQVLHGLKKCFFD